MQPSCCTDKLFSLLHNYLCFYTNTAEPLKRTTAATIPITVPVPVTALAPALPTEQLVLLLTRE